MTLIHNTNYMLLIMNILREKENVIYNTCVFLTLQKYSSTNHITSLKYMFQSIYSNLKKKYIESTSYK